MKKYGREAALGGSGDAGGMTGAQKVTTATDEALALIGMTRADIEPVALAHFTKQTKSKEEALVLYRKHEERRKNILVKLEEKRRELQTSQPKKPGKLSADVVHEQHMIEQNNKRAMDSDRNNQQILRRLAIQQLRSAFHVQKEELATARTERLSDAHRDRMLEMKKTARVAVERRTFSARPRNTEIAAVDMEHGERAVQRAQTLKLEQMRARQQWADRLKDQTTKAHEYSEKVIHDKVKQAEDRVRLTQQRADTVPQRQAEKQKQLQARAQERDALGQQKKQKIEETEAHKLAQKREALGVKDGNSKQLIARNAEEKHTKIERERQVLEGKRETAGKIIEGIKEKHEADRKVILQRLENADMRLSEQARQKRSQIFERSMKESERVKDVQRVARAREMEAQRENRERVEQATGAFKNLQTEKARSIAAKDHVRDSFAHKKERMLNIRGLMTRMSDEQLKKEICGILELSDAEAAEILYAAHQPRSLYES